MSLELLLGPQLSAFVAAGYEVIGASAPGPYVPRLRERGVTHVALRHSTRAMDPLSDARAAWELTRLFMRLKPDIVHTHNPKPGLYGRLAAWGVGVPAIVNTVHGLYATPDDPAGKRAVVYTLERVAAACSDAELVQNPEDIPVLRRLGVPADRLHLLGNGVDLSRFRPGAADPSRAARLRTEIGAGAADVVVGAVGRLVHEKGYPELFEAAAHVMREHPRVRFVVAGPLDPDKGDAVGNDEIERARRAGVVFLGARDDMVDVYRMLDVYVLASHREGWPRSAMEAAAMGLPVVATDIRGCRQVVDHEETGLLVPVRDAGALERAIARIATDRPLRARMSEAAIEKARVDFDDRRQVETTLGVYERLLHRARR